MTKPARQFEAVAAPAVERVPRRRVVDLSGPGSMRARAPAAEKPWKELLSRERPLLLELLAWAVIISVLLSVYAFSWRLVPV